VQRLAAGFGLQPRDRAAQREPSAATSTAARCAQLAAWAAQEAAHRSARDAELADLPQAPTGIGKTLGTLFPLLRAMPGQRLDKIAYLTLQEQRPHRGARRLGALARGFCRPFAAGAGTHRQGPGPAPHGPHFP